MVAHLVQEVLREVARAVTDEGLDHPTLVAGLHRGLQLKRTPEFGSVWQDLQTLNRTGRLDDGSLPLQDYIEAGLFLLERSSRTQGPGFKTFATARTQLSAALAPTTTEPAFAWSDGATTNLEKLTAGASSLLDIAWLEVGLARAEAVARIQVTDSQALGTAF